MRTADGKLRMTWRECCASLTAIGVTAMDGRPLTPETDQEDLAEGRRAKAPGRGPRLSKPLLRGRARDGALTMDDEKEGAKRAGSPDRSKKPLEDILQRVARPRMAVAAVLSGSSSITTRCDGTRRRPGVGCRGESFAGNSSVWGSRSPMGGGEAVDRQKKLATRPQGTGAGRGAPGARARGARAAVRHRSTSQHAVAISQGRVWAAARDDDRDHDARRRNCR